MVHIGVGGLAWWGQGVVRIGGRGSGVVESRGWYTLGDGRERQILNKKNQLSLVDISSYSCAFKTTVLHFW